MLVECDGDQTTYFQNIIGILQCIFELALIDIVFEVSLILNFLALPYTYHLIRALYIYKYLDMHQGYYIAFDTMYLNVEINDMVKEIVESMRNLFVDSQEDLPHNEPSPQGSPIQLNLFVHTENAGHS